MIIGVTHVADSPNHELIKLIEPAEAFQTKSLLGSKPILDQVLDLLTRVSDKVICYGKNIPTDRLDVQYEAPLTEGARNSSSLFNICRKNRHDMIVYVPSHIMCSDWEQLEREVEQAVKLAFLENQFVVVTNEPLSGPDPRLSWVSQGHFVAETSGVEHSHEVLNKAKTRSVDFEARKYVAATGICVFPAKQVFNNIKVTMPKYWDWISTSQWDLVNQLNFEQAVLENILAFKTVHSQTVLLPVNHYYQVFNFIRSSNRIQQFPLDWTIYESNPWFEIAIRRIDSHQTNVELLPATYFVHGIIPKASMDEVVFVEKEKTYRKFTRNIELMRIRKLRQ